jgi:hypothetical protein
LVRAGGLRFVGTYRDLEPSKARILAFGAGGLTGRVSVGAPRRWHIHHIVERQEFAHGMSRARSSPIVMVRIGAPCRACC